MEKEIVTKLTSWMRQLYPFSLMVQKKLLGPAPISSLIYSHSSASSREVCPTNHTQEYTFTPINDARAVLSTGTLSSERNPGRYTILQVDVFGNVHY